MARGKYATKYAAKKGGTSGPFREVDGWVGSPGGASNASMGASAKQTTRAGGQAGLPVLGIAVMSPWGWRILAVFAMVALGLCLTFFIDGKLVYGVLWTVITVAWGGFSLKLWRQHLDWDRADRQAAA